MLKVFATQVVVSKGYDNTPALRFSENGDSVRFRIGKKVYDPHAENDSRWINLPVKAFNGVCERIKKMQLKEGSYVNLIGRLDEDSWEDKDTKELRKMMVIMTLSMLPVEESPRRTRQLQDSKMQLPKMRLPRIQLRRMLRQLLRQVLKRPEILPDMRHLAADHSLMKTDWSNN